MKTLPLVLVALVSVGLVAGNAFAWSCPTLVKAANEAIAAAEPKAMAMAEGREKVRAAGLIEEAKELVKAGEGLHAAGSHARAEAKLKAAKVLAELVK